MRLNRESNLLYSIVGKRKDKKERKIGMSEKTKSYQMDMCEGALFSKLIRFAVPLMLSSILQLLFNAVDMVVVGRYAGSQSLAAVGSTSSLINLLTNVFMGLSVGANVLIARYYGARQEKEVSETVHTAILLSLISGVLLTFIGVGFAGTLLRLMGTPENVIELSVLYIRIYFIGMPVLLLYNFGSAILRAIGDTKRPLYYLTLAGVLNAGLNLIFVIVFHLDVAGVAIATVLSQAVSAFFIIRALANTEGGCQLKRSLLRISSDKLIRIAKIGLPAGFQGALFSLSNVLIQSSINSFGDIAMAGNTAASNLEGFVYIAMNSFHQTALSFTSQNIGGGKYDRVKKTMVYCLFLVVAVGGILGFGAYGIKEFLLGIYTSDAEVIQYGILRMRIIMLTYFTCGMMDVMVGCLRGMGYSIMPMIVSLLGACGLRILWIMTIFQSVRTLECLYLSYPVSWIITAAAHMGCYLCIRKKVYLVRN